MSADLQTGLAWPSHDVPTPPPEYKSRERDEDRATRKPLAWWDRVKLLFLLVGSFMVLVWATMADFAGVIITFEQAFRQTLQSQWWLLALAGLELIRQVHYLLSEHWAAWHRFWTEKFFGGFARRIGRMNDWNRFRISRILKLLFLLLIVDLIVARILDLPPALALFQLPIIAVRALPIALQIAFSFFFIIFQFVGLFWFLSRGGVEVYMPDDIKTRFTDVKGQDAVLERIKENMIFLEDPESIEVRGGYVPGGLLLWGPPGTGKTLMAQAVAGETSRPYVFVDPGAFIQMFIGVGILKVKGLYRKLRRLALRYGGVIVFFDEADSLGNRGSVGGSPGGGNRFDDGPWSDHQPCNGLSYLSEASRAVLFHDALPSTVAEPRRRLTDRIIMGAGMGGGGGMGTLQALLAEMSGLVKPRGFFNRIVRRLLGMRPKPPPKYRILHIFATNRPDVLDEAMLRPGRIDRIYKVGYPAKEGRVATFEYYLDKVKHELSREHVERLAIMTPYATGASIKDMVNEALVIAVRDGRDGITWRDIIRAKQLKEHGLPDDTEYIERERHSVAVHEACHAVVGYRTRMHAVIDVATIERRGDVGGFVSYIPPEDQFTNWKSEFEVDIMCSLASLAGERMFFDDDNSSGVAGDLRSATGVATQMEAYFGMGQTVGSHAVTKFRLTSGRSMYGGEDGTDRNLLETELGRRVEARLRDLLEQTRLILEANRREVLAVAHALETHKTMSGEDVAAIIEGERGPLVDGRPYQEGEFSTVAEDYHSLAVVAHKSHNRVPVPLPAFIPPVPTGWEPAAAASPYFAMYGPGVNAPPRPDVPGNGGSTPPAPPAGGNGGGGAPQSPPGGLGPPWWQRERRGGSGGSAGSPPAEVPRGDDPGAPPGSQGSGPMPPPRSGWIGPNDQPGPAEPPPSGWIGPNGPARRVEPPADPPASPELDPEDPMEGPPG